MGDIDAQIRQLEEQVRRDQIAAQDAQDAARRVAGPAPAEGYNRAPHGVRRDVGFARDADDRSIFISNLPKNPGDIPLTPEELARFFEDCGVINKCSLLIDRNTNTLRGTAYIEFATKEGQANAINYKNQQQFRGQPLTVASKKSFFVGRGGRGIAPGRGRGGFPPIGMMMGMMTDMMGMMMGGRGSGFRGRAGGPRGGRGGTFRGGASPGGGPAAGQFASP
jgi:hypothetical protein